MAILVRGREIRMRLDRRDTFSRTTLTGSFCSVTHLQASPDQNLTNRHMTMRSYVLLAKSAPRSPELAKIQTLSYHQTLFLNLRKTGVNPLFRVWDRSPVTWTRNFLKGTRLSAPNPFKEVPERSSLGRKHIPTKTRLRTMVHRYH